MGWTDADGIDRRSAERDHDRVLASIFGQVVVRRVAYRSRGARNLCPADAHLNLPRERHSHGLRRLAAIEASRGSYDEAAAAITRVSGVRPAKRQLEQLALRAATDFAGFQAARERAPAEPGDVPCAQLRRQGRRDAPRRAAGPDPDARGVRDTQAQDPPVEGREAQPQADRGSRRSTTSRPRRAHRPT